MFKTHHQNLFKLEQKEFLSFVQKEQLFFTRRVILKSCLILIDRK